MQRLKIWLSDQSSSAAASANSAQRKAREWWAEALRETMGDPAAARVHGLKVARPFGVAGDGERSYALYDWRTLDELSREGRELPPRVLPSRVVVLIHGLDEPGTGWDDLTPQLLKAGHTPAVVDYPNDGGIADAADSVGGSLRSLHDHGVTEVDIIAHSMGGLVARDLLTRQEWYAGSGSARDGLPRIRRFIMMAVPNAGSELACLEPVAEAREHLSRAFDGIAAGGDGWVHSYCDGAGEAAADLTPGSPFLSGLNARPLPTGVAITNITATLVGPEEQAAILKQTREIAASLRLCPPADTDRLIGRVLSAVGDGLVSARSQHLDGVADTVEVVADHRSMVRAWEWLEVCTAPLCARPEGPRDAAATPAIPIILDRLSREP